MRKIANDERTGSWKNKYAFLVRMRCLFEKFGQKKNTRHFNDDIYSLFNLIITQNRAYEDWHVHSLHHPTINMIFLDCYSHTGNFEAGILTWLTSRFLRISHSASNASISAYRSTKMMAKIPNNWRLFVFRCRFETAYYKDGICTRKIEKKFMQIRDKTKTLAGNRIYRAKIRCLLMESFVSVCLCANDGPGERVFLL